MGWAADLSIALNVILLLFTVLQEVGHGGDRRDRDLAWLSVKQWQRFHVTRVRELHRRHQAAIQKLLGWRDSMLKTQLYPKGYPTGQQSGERLRPPPLPQQSPEQDDPGPPTPSERSE